MHRFTPRPAPLALALSLAFACGALWAQASSPLAPDAAPINITLPAQPLGEALNAWARQTGAQLAVQQSLVAGKTAPAVTGPLTARQALDRLLAGSGLSATVDGAAVSIRPAAPNGTPPGADAALPEVKVTAKALGPASALGYLSKNSSTGALGDKKLLDTPFSVATVDSDDIAERGAKSIGQIFAKDAAVSTPTNSFATDWWGTQIRGLPVRNTYIDDIPMLLYWGGDFPTEITESVTALKGLTGFMYGFGEPGGALSYQLKRPKADNETLVQLGYRNPGLATVHLDTSRRLTEDTGLRANVATEQGTAYNAAKIDRTVASLALDQSLSRSVQWHNTLVYEDSRNQAEPIQLYLEAYDHVGSGGQLPTVTYDYDQLNVDNAYYRTKTLLASTGIDWAIDDQWTLKTQLGFSRKDHRSNKAFADLLNREGDYRGAMYNFAGQLDNVFSQAVLQGTVQAAGLKHDLVAGAGMQASRDRWASEFYWSNDFNGNLYREQTYRSTRTPDFALLPVSSDTRQTSVFASDTLHFNDRWQAIAGLRFTRYRIKDLDGDPAVDSAYNITNTSPTLALIHKPNAHTSLYGSYVEGLEPGARVSPPYANAGELLKATVSKQYEIGAKHEHEGVDYAAALFRVERANQIDALRGGERFLTQDGRLTYQGLELSGAYPLGKALSVGLSAVYLDATIDKVSIDNAALQGNAPSFAPRWQVAASVQYLVPAVRGLKLHGTARYAGASYTTDANTLQIPARTVFNAGFAYDFSVRGQALTLLGNVYNLFNKKYWAGGGWSAGNLGEARNVSLSLQTRF
ncbi:TonB-dependent siderophore receptor [Hydrogenophaga flava]|uniref:TonB-dependent siderophore receptor n=1 Tax=Hydrogenophaga flava TaxID=65657 RepID=UPI0008245C73|nr:TonB-dependent receptor [Hydrogenophaga flava]